MTITLIDLGSDNWKGSLFVYIENIVSKKNISASSSTNDTHPREAMIAYKEQVIGYYSLRLNHQPHLSSWSFVLFHFHLVDEGVSNGL